MRKRSDPVLSSGQWDFTSKPSPWWNVFRKILSNGTVIAIIPCGVRDPYMELAAAKPKYEFTSGYSHFRCVECDIFESSMVIVCVVGNLEYKKNICSICHKKIIKFKAVGYAAFSDDTVYSDGYYYRRLNLEPTLKCKIVCPICSKFSEYHVCTCHKWLVRGWITSRLSLLLTMKKELCWDVIRKVLEITIDVYAVI